MLISPGAWNAWTACLPLVPLHVGGPGGGCRCMCQIPSSRRLAMASIPQNTKNRKLEDWIPGPTAPCSTFQLLGVLHIGTPRTATPIYENPSINDAIWLPTVLCSLLMKICPFIKKVKGIVNIVVIELVFEGARRSSGLMGHYVGLDKEIRCMSHVTCLTKPMLTHTFDILFVCMRPVNHELLKLKLCIT